MIRHLLVGARIIHVLRCVCCGCGILMGQKPSQWTDVYSEWTTSSPPVNAIEIPFSSISPSSSGASHQGLWTRWHEMNTRVTGAKAVSAVHYGYALRSPREIWSTP